MNTPTIGFLGGGRIARIFFEGWTRANQLPTRTVVADPNVDALAKLKARFPAVETTADLAADRTTLKVLLAPLGESPEVAEEKIEAYAVFTAMGPTYLWFQMQALRKLAVSFGLTAAEAAAGLKCMVTGAVGTLVDSGLAPADVMDLVPVKPLAEMEPQVLELYRTRLPALFQKIKP
jgi:pyrroline-5-carboxylate reductase